MNVDLLAFRCPDATIKMNAILNLFMESQHETLSLVSIEPSLERNLRERIAHLGLPIEICEIQSKAICDNDKANWGSRFDEDDFGDVTVKMEFHILKKEAK